MSADSLRPSFDRSTLRTRAQINAALGIRVGRRSKSLYEAIAKYVGRFRIIPATYAALRETFSKHPLPPGELVLLEPIERSDRCVLLERGKRLGPVWKALGGGTLLVCIIGIPRCQKFLKEHANALTPVTVKLEPLFPKGFLRKMRGEEHLKYRRGLVRAIDPVIAAESKAALGAFTRGGLDRYASADLPDTAAPEAFIRVLDSIATGMLVHVFLGATLESAPFEKLSEGYLRLGPREFEWHIGRKQARCYVDIRDFLAEELSRSEGPGHHWLLDSILGRMYKNDALDETSLGQLIYMIEMGRHDLYGLFRWISKYAAQNPAILDRIAREERAGSGTGTPLAEAFVLETLRLNQSERLVRTVDRDLVFEGYLIPRFSLVRLCLWESHKSGEAFPDPFVFDPDRFVTGCVTRDQFSPFGLDQHSCPFGDLSIKLGAIFVRALACGYQVESMGDGPAVRGRYHWQPAKEFAVRLRARPGLA